MKNKHCLDVHSPLESDKKTLCSHSHKREIVWKRTMRYCSSSLIKIFLAPGPPKVHTFCALCCFVVDGVCSQFFQMPGANCSIFGCSTSRRNKELSIFKILCQIAKPTRNGEVN